MTDASEEFRDEEHLPPGTGLRGRLPRRHLLRLGLIGGVVATLLWFRRDIKYRIVVKNWGAVVPGQIYRSGQISKWLIEEQLRSKEIDLIIDMQSFNPSDPHQQHEIETASRLGIPLERFPLRGDGTGDVSSYIDALCTLREHETTGDKILLHCHAGADRTGGIFYCYRTLFDGWSPAQAIAEMGNYGWYPDPGNPLIGYLNTNLAGIARALHDRKILAAIPESLPLMPAE